MSMHKKPLTKLEHDGLLAHGLDIGTPSQISDVFRQGIAYALANAPTVQREGWVSVPIEPTEEMLKAAQSEQGDHGSYKEWLDYGYGEDVIATYKAMIQAAPKE